MSTTEQEIRIAELEKQVWKGLHEASTGMGLSEVDAWEVATALSRCLTSALEMAEDEDE